ncbi:hypothetical protein JDS99_10080 [Bacillus cereus group sp. N6]|uniref:hypothetical protein n=1 Tax=Bacillus cereus group sp. N6 TaxID=2794583 RepID=UPI0018F4628A|nr:hypothetical protein [Bacillus cereus group sp. N6]MBJ8109993.1 hypothetical protein [Bacillus cereus group sp. N6]
MTALVGYCLKDGAFLVADTQRILKQPGTETYWACVEVSKIFKLNESMGFASCGTPSDEARLKLQTQVGPNTKKEEVTKLAVQIYSELLSNIKQIDLNLIIFGHESGIGFMRQLKWDDTLGTFEIKDYSANEIVTDGFEEDRFYQIAKARLKDSISPLNNIELDLWAQFVMRDIVDWTSNYSSDYGVNPVGFPIDLMMFKSNCSPTYQRKHYPAEDLERRVQSRYATDRYSVQ